MVSAIGSESERLNLISLITASSTTVYFPRFTYLISLHLSRLLCLCYNKTYLTGLCIKWQSAC
jgi:hypothetical protein